MRKPSFKQISISVGMAVTTGVLLLGINAASGAVTPPTQDPQDANLVSPTFSGLGVGIAPDPTSSVKLNVMGSTMLDAYLHLKDSVSHTWVKNGAAGSSITSKSGNTTFMDGGVVVGGEYVDGELGDGNLNVMHDIDVRGVIKNLTGEGGQEAKGVVVQDALSVNGTLTVANNITSSGDLSISAGIINLIGTIKGNGNSLNVKSDMVLENATEAVYSTGIALLKLSHPTAAGRILMDHNDIMSVGAPLRINFDSEQPVQIGSINTTPSTPIPHLADLNLYGDLNIESGAISVDGNVDVEGDIYDSQTGSNAVTISDTDGLDVRGPIKNLAANARLQIDDDLDIRGNITNMDTNEPVTISDGLGLNVSSGKVISLNGFGTYVYGTLVNKPLAAATSTSYPHDTAVSYCPAGSVPVSCNAFTSPDTSTSGGIPSSWTRFVDIINIRRTSSGCAVEGVHTTSGTRYVWAQAVCLNPTY